MRRVGLLGGMSWESSAEYYRLMNDEVRERLGGLHSADCLLRSLDFELIERLQREARWEEAAQLLIDEAHSLVAAGAELLVLCTNTMHKVADPLARAVSIPLVHIADATADEVIRAGYSTVGLLGTRYTMEDDFYVGRLRDQHRLQVLVPTEKDRGEVHQVIYDELCVGVVTETSQDLYRQVMRSLIERGAECIVFGCTEIGLLVNGDDCSVPVFDSTLVHVRKAIDLALA